MGEEESNTQSPKSKISKMAITSVLLGILGVSVGVLRLGFYRPWWSEFVARNISALLGIVGLILGFVVIWKFSRRIAAIALLVVLCFFLLQMSPFVIVFLTRVGIVPLVQRCIFYLSVACLVALLAIPVSREWRSSSKANFKGVALAPLGTVLGVLLVGLWWMETCGPTSLAMRMACGANLTRLGKTMLIYPNDHGGCYPEPARWCDVLLRSAQVKADHFLCPMVKWEWRRQVFPWPIPRNRKCYYAMNPNCEPNSPPDTVLLFEIKGGWDKFGGLGILTVDNHQGGGCNVLFNDGHAEFVTRKRIGDLKWDVEKKKQ